MFVIPHAAKQTAKVRRSLRLRRGELCACFGALRCNMRIKRKRFFTHLPGTVIHVLFS